VGASNPAVIARPLQTYAGLAPLLCDHEQRQVILDQAEAAKESMSRRPEVSLDRAALGAVYQLAREPLSAGQFELRRRPTIIGLQKNRSYSMRWRVRWRRRHNGRQNAPESLVARPRYLPLDITAVKIRSACKEFLFLKNWEKSE
jgi:hypothetical protein